MKWRLFFFLFLAPWIGETREKVPEPSFPVVNSYLDSWDIGNRFADVNNKDYARVKKAFSDMPNSTSWYSQSGLRVDPELGNSNILSAQVRHIFRVQDKVIYDVIYTLDPYGRRWTWVPKKANTDQFVILAGCSSTFGRGVNDDETLNHFLAENLNGYYPYNYGVVGTGANSVLALVESGRLKKQIPEKKGVFIYLDIGAVDRVAGKLPALTWVTDTPYYTFHEDSVERDGTFRSGRRWWTWFLLGLHRLEPLLGINPAKIIPALASSDYRLMCAVVKKMKEEFLRSYPDSRFLVYGHGVGYIASEMKDCYQKNNIEFHQGSQVANIKGLTIEKDMHPTGKAYKMIADELKTIIENSNRTAALQ